MRDVGDAMRIIAEHSADVFWAFTPDFDELLFVNDAYEEVWGRSSESLQAQPRSLLEGVHPDDRSRAAAAMERVAAGESVDVEFRVNPAEDYGRWVWVEGTPVVDDTGEVETIVGLARDVTDRKAREEELALFREMIDESNALVYVNDVSTGELVYANRTACEELGYTQAELLEKPVYEIEESFDDRSDLAAHIDEIRAKGRMRFEGEQLRKDGSTIPVEVNLAFVDIDSEYIVAIARDISDRLERERELERHNERLERLTSVASHDLRNPLNVAAGRLELARGECDSAHLEEAVGALDRMETLIEDLLTLAREGESVERTDAIELASIVERSWANVETGDSVLVDGIEQTIRAEPSRLEQLFENLFRNAVEHGSTSPHSQTREDAVEHDSSSPRSQAREDAVLGGGDEVTVRVGELDDGFYVADDGPGIPDPQRERIFEYGYSTGSEGTGFGLSIVREIVEAHGWDIDVTTGSDGGARFEIRGVSSPPE